MGVAVNPKLNDITLTNISVSEESYGSVGGLVGIATKTGNLMSDQTVTSIAKFTDVTINKTSNGTNKIVGGTQHTGILLGFGKIITDNININDITIDGTKSQTVGTIGQADSASDVKNITVNNVNVIAKERGGIIAGISQANITGCTVNKSTITGTASGDFGGIVGNMPVGTTILSNCNVNESKLIATTGHLGGIIGSASNTISGCTLLNTNITGEELAWSGMLPEGYYKVTLRTYNLEGELSPSYASCGRVLRIGKRVPGDLNDDGEVNKTDVWQLNQYILGEAYKISDPATLSVADLNGNGVVNGFDLVLLRQMVK